MNAASVALDFAALLAAPAIAWFLPAFVMRRWAKAQTKGDGS
jgi:hypothetical protein